MKLPDAKTLATSATALSALIKTLTDPEMVERLTTLGESLRSKAASTKITTIEERANQLGEQLDHLDEIVDTDEERDEVSDLRRRHERIVASIPATTLGTTRVNRKLGKQVRRSLDSLTADIITMLVGEAIEEEPAEARRWRRKALPRVRRTRR